MNRFIHALSPFALCLLFLVAAPSLQANPSDMPFASSNRSPFVLVYGLPVAQSAQLQHEQQLSTGLQIDIANNFSEDRKGNEAVFIDGETHRANLQLRYGLNNEFEVGLDIPYLSHQGGGLDGFIENWHEFWGLPNGNRELFPRNQLDFSYQKNGELVNQLNRSTDGLGDVSVTLAYQLANSDLRQWALRSSIKLPTGDADALLGSESTDIALTLAVSDQGLLQAYNIGLHASAGVLWMDDGKVLNELREDWVVYGSSTLSWQATTALNFKLQLDAHSAFYQSALTQLGSDSAQLIVGGTIRLSDHWLLDLAVSEDIAVDTAPDVVFHLGLKTFNW